MPDIKLKCIVCGNDKVETTYVRLVVKGADAAACSGCMPVVIHGSESRCH